MWRYLSATLLVVILMASEVRGQCNDGGCNGGWLQGAPGLTKYEEKSRDTSRSDENLTIMLIVGSGIAGVVIGATFLREALSLSGPRPRHPWDEA